MSVNPNKGAWQGLLGTSTNPNKGAWQGGTVLATNNELEGSSVCNQVSKFSSAGNSVLMEDSTNRKILSDKL